MSMALRRSRKDLGWSSLIGGVTVSTTRTGAVSTLLDGVDRRVPPRLQALQLPVRWSRSRGFLRRSPFSWFNRRKCPVELNLRKRRVPAGGSISHRLSLWRRSNIRDRLKLMTGSRIDYVLSRLRPSAHSFTPDMTDTGCLRVGQQALISQPPQWWTKSSRKSPCPSTGQVCGAVLLSAGLHLVCPTEITAFSDRYADFSSKNTEVLAFPWTASSATAWIQTPRNQGGLGDINYPLVADLKKEISTAYNVLDEAEVLPCADCHHRPRWCDHHATINNLPVGRNVDETLRVLQAFQYVQSNPDEVCPANWTPGEKTMKPDPKGSRYFSAIG